MIALEDVEYYHVGNKGRTRVFENLSGELPTDRRLVVFGARGSGRTTLAWLLSELIDPARGRVRRDVRVSPPVGFFGGFRPKLTIAQNASYLAEIYGADRRAVLDYVASLPLIGQRMDLHWGVLPRKTRVWTSQLISLAIPFDVYVFDGAPFGEVPEMQAYVEAVLWQRLEHAGLIMLAPNVRVGRAYADCAAILNDGQLAFYEDVEDCVQDFNQLGGMRGSNAREPETGPEQIADASSEVEAQF
ncbi:capsular polysaccharide transport system ATP-binding protein [Faunimonas pinastri]|uniref:Capsular polysaccharide transport system ATP-binding protein n=1 Tax=Faunimonas pinastri TaxID=1855383 RepID=A0A1H9FHH1_9HYPH|nr:hypothetical protein [Faunimonas pinastri]SEQ37352.1 capsular polysaccharide transport system ATP-binding protein [Faunimonas pinastri]